jgi:hypothetical protein
MEENLNNNKQMNILLIIILCLSSFYACNGQEHMHPTIENIKLVTDRGIEYKFHVIIKDALDKVIANTENDIHIIRLQIINDSTFTLIVYCLNKGGGETITTNPLIINTGRFYHYKNLQIPIIFDTDYKFSTPDFVITHSCYRITFKTNDDKTIILHQEL